MKKYLETLKNVSLFQNISEADLPKMLNCLNSTYKNYEKGNIIFLTGEAISQVGIVCSGNVQVVSEDYLGNRTILTELSSSDVFGETFACANITISPVTVLATTKCDVVFIDYKKIITACQTSCVFHSKLIENMLKLLANKNLMLNAKIQCISKRSTREKLLAYFAIQMEKTKSNLFDIPFTRQELSDFLCVERSAMSRELSKMRDDRLLIIDGNKIEILS